MKGAVLGANFMSGHDVLFDVDNKRVGFADSDCTLLNYSTIIPPPSSLSGVTGWDDAAQLKAGAVNTMDGWRPRGPCTARCDAAAGGSSETNVYVRHGEQSWSSSEASAPPVVRSCSVLALLCLLIFHYYSYHHHRG